MTARPGSETTLGEMARMRGCSHVDARVHVHVQVTFMIRKSDVSRGSSFMGWAWHGRLAKISKVCVGGWVDWLRMMNG